MQGAEYYLFPNASDCFHCIHCQPSWMQHCQAQFPAAVRQKPSSLNLNTVFIFANCLFYSFILRLLVLMCDAIRTYLEYRLSQILFKEQVIRF